MRKTLTALSVAAALFAGQAMADQATLDSLHAQGVLVPGDHAAVIASAEGPALVNAIAALVEAMPHMAAQIVAAAVDANPQLALSITAAAANAANNAKLSPPSRFGNGASVPTSSMPSIGGSGGGSTSLASPN